MARQAPTGWSTANYLTRAGVIRNGEGLLISAWVHTYDATQRTIWDQGQSGTANHKRSMLTPGSARIRATSQTTGSGDAQTAATLPIGAWGAGAAAFVSSTLRSAYHSGAGQVDNTTSVVPNAPNQLRIGINNATLLPWQSTGAIAEVSVWDITGFADTDIDALVALLHTLVDGNAPNPMIVNAQAAQAWTSKILAYWPLDVNDTDPYNDKSGNGHHMTMAGTLTAFASYPPVNAATVTAGVTGTIFGRNEPRIESDIVAGGRTIILTLANTTWVAVGATFDAERQAIINGLSAASSPADGWNTRVRDTLAVTTVVRTSDTVVTVTLPAVAAYDIAASEVLTATIPASAVASAGAVVATPTITIHPVPVTTQRATRGWAVPGEAPPTPGNFLQGPAFVTADGFLVSLWMNIDANAKVMPWQLGKPGIESHHRRFLTEPGESLKAGSWYNPTGEQVGDPGFDIGQDHTGNQANAVDSGTAILEDRWIHGAGAWISTTSRYVWIYGDLASEGSNATLSTPNTPTATFMGARSDGADGFDIADQMAEVSVWDISAMSIAQIRTLVTALSTLTDGLAPNPLTLDAQVGQVWTGKLLSYPDLDFTSATWTQDRSGNHAAYTEVGTLTEGASYPPVAAVAGGGFTSTATDLSSRMRDYLADLYSLPATTDLSTMIARYLREDTANNASARFKALMAACA